VAAPRVPYEELAGLAAAHAALDPERQEWRGDILISSLIEILAVKGALSERELQRQIKAIWQTDAVDRSLLRTALEHAEGGRLIERRGHGRDIRWAVTQASAADAEIDHRTAEAIVERFEASVGERLPELLENHDPIEAPRLRRLTLKLIAAFMAGSQEVFSSVARTGDPATLRSIDFKLSEVDRYLEARIKPERDVPALKALAFAAFSPDEEFGKEILHLIVAGKVLQGMLGRHDLTQQGSVEGSMLLLDTSVLVYRMESPGPHSELLEELWRVGQDAHCDLVVTRAVIDEWDGLWLSAEADAPKANDLPTPLTRWSKNVVLRNWRSQTDHPRPRTWQEFEHGYRSIESWLTDHKVRIIEDEPDPDLVERMRQKLLDLATAGENSTRTLAGARTDAYSAAIVAKARERDEASIPHAWFIAEDRLTNQAYEAVRTQDEFPVAASVEAWLLMASATRTDDPDHARNLAEIVGESAILNSFLAVSASYGVEELVEIADVLKKASNMSPEELAEAVRTDLVAYAESQSPNMPAELLRRRAHRREALVQRREEMVRAAEQDRDARAQAEEQRRREELDRIKELEESKRCLEASNRRLRRMVWLAVALFAMAVPVAIAAVLGAPRWWWIGGAAIWAAISLSGFLWVWFQDQSAAVFVLVMAATVAWTIASAALAVAIAPSAAAQSSRPGVQQHPRAPTSARPQSLEAPVHVLRASHYIETAGVQLLRS